MAKILETETKTFYEVQIGRFKEGKRKWGKNGETFDDLGDAQQRLASNVEDNPEHKHRIVTNSTVTTREVQIVVANTVEPSAPAEA